jgi:putative SOS response-associated peptidase YedK
MCGRFSLTVDPADLRDSFPEFTFPTKAGPRFNIAPTQPVLVVPNDGSNKADYFVWGLIPSWAKDPSIGNNLINARAESLAEKPAFRSAYKYHRCIIFADGFFEWQPQPGTKTKIPHYIRLKSNEPFAFAGLWDHWQSPDGSEVKSATIITTDPNELTGTIHNRMPVILPKEAIAQWLNPEPAKAADLQGLLVPYPAEEMKAYPISTAVNAPANDSPEVINPA